MASDASSTVTGSVIAPGTYHLPGRDRQRLWPCEVARPYWRQRPAQAGSGDPDDPGDPPGGHVPALVELAGPLRDQVMLKLGDRGQQAGVEGSIAWSSTTRSTLSLCSSPATLTRLPTDRPIRVQLGHHQHVAVAQERAAGIPLRPAGQPASHAMVGEHPRAAVPAEPGCLGLRILVGSGHSRVADHRHAGHGLEMPGNSIRPRQSDTGNPTPPHRGPEQRRHVAIAAPRMRHGPARTNRSMPWK